MYSRRLQYYQRQRHYYLMLPYLSLYYLNRYSG